MFTAETSYDEAIRYLLNKARESLLFWLMRSSAKGLRFDEWMPTQLTMPEQKERICDAIADVTNEQLHGMPTAVLVEVSSVPDPLMFARLLIAGGLCWATRKPHDLPGDRYQLSAVVVNLTGRGNCSQDMKCGEGRWLLQVIERNLCDYSAEKTITEVRRGKAPRAALTLISLMQGGDDPAIIPAWLAEANREPEPMRRGDLSLVCVLADAAGRGSFWRNALEGWNVVESEMVAKWKSEARAKGKAEGMTEGITKGKADLILMALERLGDVPEDLSNKVRQCQDETVLDRLFRFTLSAKTLAQFRKQANI